MNNKLIGFFLSVALFSHSFCESTQSTIIRAAIDIGMGGPKLQVAEIDPATNKIIKNLHTQRYFVNFYESISQSSDHRLCSETKELGLKAVKEAINKANSFKAEGIVAIATEAFRLARNGAEFANEIQNEIGIKVHIVDQNLEGKLAFAAALSRLDVDAENLIVWDIGGGSIQFIGMAPENTYLIDCSKQGAGAFKDYILDNIQHRNRKECNTPNPMSFEDIAQAKIHARYLSKSVSNIFKDKISHPNTKIVGAGNVFGYGINGMLEGKIPFSITDLSEVVYNLVGKTDTDLGGGDYAFCEGSNTILILGFMEELGIKQMEIIAINNADGALIYQPFWQ